MARMLLRRGLPRDVNAATNLTAFLVTTVATVLGVRGALAASGYPRIADGGLHIAHVLWGGLLLALGLGLQLSFVGAVIRPVAAIVGGIGFGLFLDEVGKFVSADTNYFFKPAVAIMYVTIVLLVLLTHWFHTARPPQPEELLAGAVTEAGAASAGGFSAKRRAMALDLVDRAGPVPGADETRRLIEALPYDGKELLDPVLALRGIWEKLKRVFHTKLARRITLIILCVQAFGTLLVITGTTIIEIFDRSYLDENFRSIGSIGSSACSAISGLCAALGLWYWRRNRDVAWGWFQRALLVDLLLTQVFALAQSQFSGLPGVFLDLVMLAVIAAARAGDRAQVLTAPPAPRPPAPA